MGSILREHKTSVPQMYRHIKSHRSANTVFSITVLSLPNGTAFPKLVSLDMTPLFLFMVSLLKYIWKNYVVPVYANESSGLCILYCPIAHTPCAS